VAIGAGQVDGRPNRQPAAGGYVLLSSLLRTYLTSWRRSAQCPPRLRCFPPSLPSLLRCFPFSCTPPALPAQFFFQARSRQPSVLGRERQTTRPARGQPEADTTTGRSPRTGKARSQGGAMDSFGGVESKGDGLAREGLHQDLRAAATTASTSFSASSAADATRSAATAAAIAASATTAAASTTSSSSPSAAASAALPAEARAASNRG